MKKKIHVDDVELHMGDLAHSFVKYYWKQQQDNGIQHFPYVLSEEEWREEFSDWLLKMEN